MKRPLLFPERRAFTLIELLVSVAVIALLLVLAMPALQKMRETARRTASVTNIRAIGGGLLGWIQEANRGRFPYAYVSTVQTSYPAGFDASSLPTHYSYWAGAVYHGGYVGSLDVFFAPGQKTYWKEGAFLQRMHADKNAWQWGVIGYGANGVLMPYSTNVNGKPTGSIFELADRSSVILLAEAKPNPSQSSNGKYDGFHAVRPKLMTYPLAVRNGDKVAVCYADGHAGLLTAGELGWDLKTERWASSVSDTAPPWNMQK